MGQRSNVLRLCTVRAQYVGRMSEPPNTTTVLTRSEDADGTITCVTRVATLTNPIPSSLQRMLGCRDDFAFTITETWRRDRFDADSPMRFTIKPPVLAERITVSGSQWVEARETGSRLFFELQVVCRVSGVGKMIAKGIADGSLASYQQLPARALEYTALRRAGADETDAYERASRLTENDGAADPAADLAADMTDAATDATDATTDSGGKGSTTAAAVTAAAAAAAAVAGSDERAARAVRARMRWRMALMGVRFHRNLALHQSDDYRLCDATLDDPRTEGFGLRAHTTYRVSTRLRHGSSGSGLSGDGVGDGVWRHCRKRFSDFAALRAALVPFLPGLDVPVLPERHVPHRLSQAVVESRRVALQAFLQAVLDHPLLATADAVAAFLGWSDAHRAPFFARAQASYQTPAAPQRLARAKLWALRRAAQHSSREEVSGREEGTGGRGSTGSLAGHASSRSSPEEVPLARVDSTLSTEPLSRRTSAASTATYFTPAVSRLGSAADGPLRPTQHPLAGSHSVTDVTDSSCVGGAATTAAAALASHPHRPSSFSDALAVAMLHTLDDAASVMQARARERLASSCRTTSVADDDDADAGRGAAPSGDAHGDASDSRGGGRGSGGRGSVVAGGSLAAAAEAIARLSSRVDRCASAGRDPGRAAPRQEAAPAPSDSTTAAGDVRHVSHDASGDAMAMLVLQKLDDIEQRLRAVERSHRQRWWWESLFGCGGSRRG